MTPMDTEAARIRAVVWEWAERVKRGVKMPRYGFDMNLKDLGKGEKDG